MLNTAFGPEIAKFLEDDDVIEIMLNPDGKLWVDSLTSGQSYTGFMIPAVQAANIIKLVAASQQAIVDREYPEVSCELPETGARFQGWLPPIVSAPTFAIRKRAIRIFTLQDYIQAGSIRAEEALWLSEAVKMRKNILIAGGTASGKTTFANALLHELHDTKDRVIILEDLPELQVNITNHVKLRTSETKTMRDLVKGALRLRPDRIIIGEIRDAAALELLKAWNTGHPGGICTVHANNPHATLTRLEDLVQEAISAVPKRLIGEAVDIIVFMQRDLAGNYRVSSIHEYVSIDNEYLLREYSLGNIKKIGIIGGR
ncbi:MAG: P-type conjugative transfer ATPase TrbB [Gammaproteobacteria bacterium]